MNMASTHSRQSKQQNEHDSLSQARAFLDATFPLDSGSHRDVCSYLVYYQHLLACFADGSHSGLRRPDQFVALCGHRCEPLAILLKDKDTHVELALTQADSDGGILDDVQIETRPGEEELKGDDWMDKPAADQSTANRGAPGR